MKPNIAVMQGSHKPKKRSNGTDPLGPNSEIGRKLKQYYDGLVSEDVPDRFAELLEQLEERENDDTRHDGA